ncbi:MAG: molecular chaperone DnaK [Deltaproteobacteria bacterium]|nr:molecular chaperone DnaK [Deltaproteobacteria bacterium]
MSSQAIGIDLGTTFSAVAYVNQHNVPEIIPNAHGDRITPSVILFDNDKQIIGIEAEKNAMAYAGQVAQFIKRHMGDPGYRFNYKDKSYTAIELSSLLIKNLKEGAQKRLNQEEIKYAVITVPAYFGQKERKATIEAGERAGLKVLKIINEPTAAAVAYGLNHRGSKKRCLVYDLGGGTFDVTIIEIQDNVIRVRSTEGDPKLGGKDWDDRLMEHVINHFQETYPEEEPLNDKSILHDLRARCTSAKFDLTQRPETRIIVTYRNKPLRLTITREDFENLTKDLLERTLEKTQTALKAAKYTADEIDTVLLVGGSTRMPMVRRNIREMFKQEPSTEINPDECVALGAALTAALAAALESGKEAPIDIKTKDVAVHSLGMAAYQDGTLFNNVIIRKNTTIPFEHTVTNFANTHNGQSMMNLWMLQGDSINPLECTALGHFEFYGIPPRKSLESKISVTYRYNQNGIVELEARDIETDKVLSHRISSEKYSLHDVINDNIPAHVAIIIDCSGSMYGEALESAKVATRRFIEKNMNPNCSFAIFKTQSTKAIAGPTYDPAKLSKALNEVVAIGKSTLHRPLQAARRALKNRGSIFVIISDGYLSRAEDAQKECAKIRKTGGRIFAISVGPNPDKESIKSLCVTDEDYAEAYDTLSIKHALNNILTRIER